MHKYGRNLSGKAIKECLNGTWFMKNGLEWTDYTPCLDVQVSRLIHSTKDLSIQFHSVFSAEYSLYRWNNMTLKERREKGLMAINGIVLIWLGGV